MDFSTTPKECGVCQNDYNEETRCPRILKCFHTICHDCIDLLIRKNNKRCPFCKKKFKATTAYDVIMNHTMLELVKYLSPRNDVVNEVKMTSSQTVSGPKMAAPNLRQERMDRLKEDTMQISTRHLSTCLEQQKVVDMLISEIAGSLKTLALENNRIEKEVLPKIHSIITKNIRTSEELSHAKNELLSYQKELKNNSQKLLGIRTDLETSDGTFMQIAALMDKAEEVNATLGEMIVISKESISAQSQVHCEREKEIKDMSENLNVIMQVLDGNRAALKPLAVTSLGTASSTSFNIQLVTAQNLRQMNSTIKSLVDQGRLYAIQQHVGKRRIARISIADKQKVCIHHLKDESLPVNAVCLQHGEVMTLVNTNSRLAFLELSKGESVLGRLYIRLTPETMRAKNFSILCSGEKGPTYVGSNILGIDNKGQEGESIWCGDYSHNDGSGGMALVPGAGKEFGELCKRPWFAGSVEGGWEYKGDDKAAQFLIYTKEKLGVMLDAAFGFVEEGLGILTGVVSSFPDVTDVMITDCGLVLFTLTPSKSKLSKYTRFIDKANHII